MILLLLAQLTLATWEHGVQFPVLHQGHWRSCNGEERVLEHVVNGKLQWELHLGAGEFALFEHQTNDIEPGHPGNLLTAPKVDDMQTWKGKRQWAVSALHLWISIVRAGEAPEGCEAFFVKVEHQR